MRDSQRKAMFARIKTYACTGTDKYGFMNERLVVAKTPTLARKRLMVKYPDVKKWKCVPLKRT